MGNCAYIDVQVYVGGTSQDVKRQKKSRILTLYALTFLDHLLYFCFDENYHVF